MITDALCQPSSGPIEMANARVIQAAAEAGAVTWHAA
jgi:hypothetical protein